jgi:redox-sensitive bicupin YhaK (pirin superfamily)
VRLRRSAERGLVDKGWVRSLHSFNFGRHYHPDHGGFRSLIVLNEDWIQPAQGFEPHAHSDTEIITYVLAGQLSHEDNLGNRHLLGPGDVMATTTGRGLLHTETNPSPDQELYLWQIWLLPERKRRAPACAHRHFSAEDKGGRLCLVVSRDGRQDSLRLGVDADLLATVLRPGETVQHALRPGRGAWLQVVRGAVTLNGVALEPGDAAALDAPADAAVPLAIAGAADSGQPAEVLLFDLP